MLTELYQYFRPTLPLCLRSWYCVPIILKQALTSFILTIAQWSNEPENIEAFPEPVCIAEGPSMVVMYRSTSLSTPLSAILTSSVSTPSNLTALSSMPHQTNVISLSSGVCCSLVLQLRVECIALADGWNVVSVPARQSKAQLNSRYGSASFPTRMRIRMMFQDLDRIAISPCSFRLQYGSISPSTIPRTYVHKPFSIASLTMAITHRKRR